MSVDSSSLRRDARAAGLLYLFIIVAAGFAEGGVRAGLVFPGDAAATARAIADAPGFFRLGLLADLAAFVADAVVAVLLYLVLRHVSEALALVAAALRLVAHPAIGALNLLNHAAAGVIVTEAGPRFGWSPEQIAETAALAMELHGLGYVLAGAFFGVHCVLLGILLVRSPLFPALLGVLMAAAGLGYLFEVVAVFGAPGLTGLAAGVVVVTAVAGEVSLCLYLLVKGVRGAPTAAGAPG